MVEPHYLGSEASANPAAPELARIARELGDAGFKDGTVSVRYGPRVTVNAAGAGLAGLGEGGFVEVADYDTKLDRVVCIGSAPPAPDAGVHQLVYRAKREVMVILEVRVPGGHEALGALPAVERGASPLESAMNLLGALRGADAVAFGGDAVVAVGGSLREARGALRGALGIGEASS